MENLHVACRLLSSGIHRLTSHNPSPPPTPGAVGRNRRNKVPPKAVVCKHVSPFAGQELGQERTTSPSDGNSRAEVVM